MHRAHTRTVDDLLDTRWSPARLGDHVRLGLSRHVREFAERESPGEQISIHPTVHLLPVGSSQRETPVDLVDSRPLRNTDSDDYGKQLPASPNGFLRRLHSHLVAVLGQAAIREAQHRTQPSSLHDRQVRVQTLEDSRAHPASVDVDRATPARGIPRLPLGADQTLEPGRMGRIANLPSVLHLRRHASSATSPPRSCTNCRRSPFPSTSPR